MDFSKVGFAEELVVVATSLSAWSRRWIRWLAMGFVAALCIACSGADESTAEDLDGSTQQARTLNPPQSLRATAVSAARIDLAWIDTNGGSIAYSVERGPAATGPFTAIATTPPGASSYASVGLTASTTYAYRVRAIWKNGVVSNYSNVAAATTGATTTLDTAAPSVPTGLNVSVTSCSQMSLTWSGSTDTGGSGLAGYKVYRNGSQVGTVTTTSYNSTGLAALTPYSFSVVAYDNAGNQSALSAAVSATTPACTDMTAPSVPTGLTATAASCSQINLSWSASTDSGGSGLAGYKVFRGGVQVATTSTTSYSNTGLTASTSYSYTVAAYDNAGNTSAQSAAVSRTTPACADTTAPTVPAGLTATAASCSQINLSWLASTDTGGSGLAGYKVFRGGVQITTTTSAAYSSTGLAASTSYSYAVAAYDNAGNTSPQATAVSATTPGCTPLTGAHIWSRHFSGTVLSDISVGNGIAVDGNGDSLVVGEFKQTVSFGGGSLTSAGDLDVFLVKYSASGSHLWSKRFGGTGTDRGYGVAVDVSGNVMIAGNFTGTVDFGGGFLTSAGGVDIFVAKYSSAGAHLWSKRYGGTGHDVAQAIAVDLRNGDFVITGYFGQFGGPVDFGGGNLTSAGNRDDFIAKYTSLGAHVWAKQLGGTEHDNAVDIAVDASGNSVIIGSYSGTVNFGFGSVTSHGATDIFISKYSAAGDPAWSKQAGDTSNDEGRSVAIDPSGNVIAIGAYNGTINLGGSDLGTVGIGGNMFTVKYDSSGTHVWSKRFGQGYIGATGVATDTAGNILLTGAMVGGADFGGGALWGGGSWDVFIAKLTSDSTHVWSKRFGPLFDDFGYAVASDANGNVIVTGTYIEPIDFGGGVLPAPGSTDTFLVKLGP